VRSGLSGCVAGCLGCTVCGCEAYYQRTDRQTRRESPLADFFLSPTRSSPLARSAASSYTIYNTHTPTAHAQARASGPPASLAAPDGAAALHSQVNRVESSIQEGLIASIYYPCLLLMPCTNTTPLTTTIPLKNTQARKQACLDLHHSGGGGSGETLARGL